MTAPAIQTLLRSDRWTVAHGALEPGPYIIRYREPVLEPTGASDYGHCLRIVWTYAREGSGLLPNRTTTARLEAFEATLLTAFERDACAVLTAVVTFDGARQWVLYTKEPEGCGERINSALRTPEPLPIELDMFPDPAWEYLRHEVLLRVKSSPT